MAWHLWRRGIPFRVVDSGRKGSSHVAAGLIHAVTGKQCAVAEDFAVRRNEAAQFYQACEKELARTFWHELEVIRFIEREDFAKMRHKFEQGKPSEWVLEITQHPRWPTLMSILLRGGARLDVPLFLTTTREFFSRLGCYEELEIMQPVVNETTIFCEGSQGLIRGNPVKWQHRCARGEILTVRAPSWQQKRLVTGRGWLVPVGDDIYKVGSTYEWDDLERGPSEAGLRRLIEMVRFLGGDEFDTIAHDVGIRPILRKSQPVAGKVAEDVYVFNGLGSKGSLYAPWAAEQLVNLLVDEVPLDSYLSVDDYFVKFPTRS